MKRDLQRDNVLNRSLSFITKTARAEKFKIFNAPQNVEAEDIVTALLKTYRAYQDEIKILKSQRSSQDEDSKDWILVLPTELGRAAILGGITLGFRHCRVRPHTSIQRCIKCQSFVHSSRQCPNDHFCPTCGNRHEPRDCNKTPNCINCLYSKREDGTNYTLSYRAQTPAAHYTEICMMQRE